jgi:hypothetical protein
MMGVYYKDRVGNIQNADRIREVLISLTALFSHAIL